VKSINRYDFSKGEKMDKFIKVAYDKLDDETKKHLGKSSISEMAVDNEDLIIHYFENGFLVFDKKREMAFPLYGYFYTLWKELGGFKSFLGLPTSVIKEEITEGHKGYVCTFQNGSIHHIPFYPKKEKTFVKFSIPVIRPDDMLALIFEFINLKPVITAEKNAVLEPVSKSRHSYINVFFPQQSIAEQAIPEGELDNANLPWIVKSRISGLSRLSFVVPSEDTIPLNLDSLLEKCEAYDLSVNYAARPPENQQSIPYELDFDFVKKAGLRSPVSVKKFNMGDIQTSERINKMLGRLRSDLVKNKNYDTVTINQDYKKVFEGIDKDLLNNLRPVGSPHYTKIEAPYRLIISPNRYAQWKYFAKPNQEIMSISGRIALWHTQLTTKSKINGVEIDEGQKEYLKTIRAIDFKKGKNPFITSLNEGDRCEIVQLTSNFELKDDTEGQYQLEPVEARQLMLTPLGASLDFFGKWDYCGTKFSLINWVHNATMARDHYVKVVRKGVLYPLGHKAVYIKITERKFHPEKPGNTAYLRQREFIVVIEPEKFHRNDDSLSAQKYQFPFNSTQITSLVTPNLDPNKSPVPCQSDNTNNVNTKTTTPCGSNNHNDTSQEDGRKVFWPKAGNKKFLFNVVGEDLNGKTSEWSMPLIFVDNTCIDDVNIYKGMYDSQTIEEEEIKMHGQTVTYAEPLDNDNTALETEKLTFDAVVEELAAFSFTYPFKLHSTETTSKNSEAINMNVNGIFQPSLVSQNNFSGIHIAPPVEEKPQLCKDKLPFSAVIKKAKIVLPAIKYLLGNEQSAEFEYAEIYKKNGPKNQNDENEMDKFFEAAGGGIDLSFSGKGDKAGGLIKPDMSIKGLTREATGFIGGAAALQDKNVFSPKDFFGDSYSGPKLFGIFNLFEILEDFKLDEAPKFITETLTNSDEKKIKLDWNPKLKSYPSLSSNPTPAIFEPVDEKMEVAVEMTAKSRTNDNQNPNSTIGMYCKIKQFNINIIGTDDLHFLTLKFDKIEFKSTSGKKPEVDVMFNDIQFAGPLSFVNTLTDIIPFDGFSDPPNIDVTENGISAGFSLEVPAITVGVFSLQNITVGANFTVPFINDPLTVRFFFCERHQPFLLTVYVFGGGGFFTMTVTLEGFYMLEAGFEFGLCLAMNFGVAKGSVKAMGGVYFSIAKETIDGKDMQLVTLIGYFHIAGQVRVIGMINASILLALDLIYESQGNKLTGEASVKIEVEVLFFSATVEVKCKKQFAGAKSDPVFTQIMDKYTDEDGEHDPWREYCEAFA